MPKRISIDTFSLTEDEVTSTTHSVFLQIAQERKLSTKQISKLKSYRRLLKVRDYGKEFRKREKGSIDRMKQDKVVLEREVKRLRKEIEWYAIQNSILETVELLELFNSQ